MIHVVLDPPTLVEGLGWPDSPANTVVEAALAGRFVPVATARLLDELGELLGSKELRRGFGARRRLVDLCARMSLVVEPSRRVELTGSAETDHLLEAAETARARYLVTRAAPLLELGSFRGTRIVRPR